MRSHWGDLEGKRAAGQEQISSASSDGTESLCWPPKRVGTTNRRRGGAKMSNDQNLTDFLNVIAALEKQRGSRICCMIHKAAHIFHPTRWWLRRDRKDVGRGDKIELLLYSPGGHPEIAYQVMKFLRGRYTTVNVIVPLGAKSAATLMCLGADKIYMGELAELGPIDIQLDDLVEQGGKSFSPLVEF